MCSDGSGHFAISTLIIGTIIGAAIGFGTCLTVDYFDDGKVFNGSVSLGEYVGTTLLGRIVGALSGVALTGTSVMMAGIAGGSTGSYTNAIMTQMLNKDINLGAMYTNAVAGGIMGALGTINLTQGVAFAKMLVSGISNMLISKFYGESWSDAACKGLLCFTLSAMASFGLHYGQSIIGNSQRIKSKYESAFLIRYISYILNFIRGK